MPFHSLASIDSAFSIVYSSLVQNLVFLSPISGICKNWKDFSFAKHSIYCLNSDLLGLQFYNETSHNFNCNTSSKAPSHQASF
jgi:hypothetical protein